MLLHGWCGELGETGGDAWDNVREGFAQAIHDLSGAFHTAFNRFRDETGEDEPSLRPPAGGMTDSGVSSGA